MIWANAIRFFPCAVALLWPVLRTVPQDVLEKTFLNYQPQTRRPFGVMEWPALLRKLDRMDPGYRY